MFTVSNSSGVMKSSSLDSRSNVSNSLAEPKAMYKNCWSSLSERLADPSAILTGTEVQALLICEVKPNLSSIGNLEVSRYIFLTSAKLCFHTSRFWCGFIDEVLDVKSIYSSFMGNREWKIENKRTY